MENPKAQTSDKTIPSLIVVCLVYLFLCLFFLAFSKPCSNSSIPLIGTHLTCLAPNEVGDLLAGIFAPLAFLGLFWAVIIQSRELKAQKEELSLTREELRLTREEMKLARDTQIEQVKEMKASTELIGSQTETIKQQQRTRLLEIKDQQYEKIKNNILDYVQHLKHLDVMIDFQENGRRNSSVRVDLYDSNIMLKNCIDVLRSAELKIKESLINKGVRGVKWQLADHNIKIIEDFVVILDQTNALKSEISQSCFNNYRFHGFDELRVQLEKLKSETYEVTLQNLNKFLIQISLELSFRLLHSHFPAGS